MKILGQIQDSLNSLHGLEAIPEVSEYICPSTDRNALVVREEKDEAEALVFLQKKLLDRISSVDLPKDFELSLLPDLSVVIEELSHFNLFCQRASEDRPLSALEMEVQSEVDKFALALEWIDQLNENHFENQVYEAVFENYRLGVWVTDEERVRYVDANQIARNFCRSVLKDDSNHEARRDRFRSFFHLQASDKLSLKF